MTAQLEEAVSHGLSHLVLYQTATGAWDCTARHKTSPRVGHSVLRTPEASMRQALTDFVSKMTPSKEDPFQ